MRDTIIQRARAAREPIPEAISNIPSLQPGLELFYQAFLDLTTCRGTGYSTEGPISWLSIHQWCEIYKIRGEQREDIFYHVQALDKVYLDHKAKQLAKK